MKPERAKVFVVFLGAALLLSPLIMLISCNQLHKAPPPPPHNLTNPTPENPAHKPSNPTPNTKYKITVTQPANGAIEVTPALPAAGIVDTGSELTFTLSAHTNYKVKTLTINGTTYSAVTDNTITQKVKIEKNTAVSAMLEAASNPTPDAGTFTDTQGNNVTIEPVKSYGGEITGYRLTGDIYIEELNSEAFKAKLNTLNGKELYTDSLNINCFTNQNSTITAKEITPEILKGVLELKKERKFSTLKLNNETPNGTINILFESTIEKPFDISDLAKFRFSEGFKLTENSELVLGGLPLQEDETENDKAKYITVDELVRVIKQKHFKNFKIKKHRTSWKYKNNSPLSYRRNFSR